VLLGKISVPMLLLQDARNVLIDYFVELENQKQKFIVEKLPVPGDLKDSITECTDVIQRIEEIIYKNMH
jgi:hypothetical protein